MQAIKIEDVSKLYCLGEVGTGSFAHDLNRLWSRIRGKGDPYAKIGEENDRTKASDSDYVWALRDVSFEVEAGQVLGIIGRNGAGKSTLLKILSRVTAPTSGKIKARGRIASLLEVGTGFHPDLTGRENIFLNGAILGMKRDEIKRQLDAIVDFSGCARYIDTPVKRYSSGMMVRLGFSVAAHLQCEILIIDEVLAVGDLEFQKACIGRMRTVSRDEGKTVVFVSHNMATVATLCDSAALMHRGTVVKQGAVGSVIADYLSSHCSSQDGFASLIDHPTARHAVASLISVESVSGGSRTADASLGKDLELRVLYRCNEPHARISTSIHVNDNMGGCVFATVNNASAMLNPLDAPSVHEVGTHLATCLIPRNFLNSDQYYISVFLQIQSHEIIAYAENCIQIQCHDTGEMRKEYGGRWIGAIRPQFRWITEKLPESMGEMI